MQRLRRAANQAERSLVRLWLRHGGWRSPRATTHRRCWSRGPRSLRRRLALTSGQVAAQREAVARASSALDRAIDVLLPDLASARQASVYGVPGTTTRLNSGGLAQA